MRPSGSSCRDPPGRTGTRPWAGPDGSAAVSARYCAAPCRRSIPRRAAAAARPRATATDRRRIRAWQGSARRVQRHPASRNLGDEILRGALEQRAQHDRLFAGGVHGDAQLLHRLPGNAAVLAVPDLQVEAQVTELGVDYAQAEDAQPVLRVLREALQVELRDIAGASGA